MVVSITSGNCAQRSTRSRSHTSHFSMPKVVYTILSSSSFCVHIFYFFSQSKTLSTWHQIDCCGHRVVQPTRLYAHTLVCRNYARIKHQFIHSMLPNRMQRNCMKKRPLVKGRQHAASWYNHQRKNYKNMLWELFSCHCELWRSAIASQHLTLG